MSTKDWRWIGIQSVSDRSNITGQKYAFWNKAAKF